MGPGNSPLGPVRPCGGCKRAPLIADEPVTELASEPTAGQVADPANAATPSRLIERELGEHFPAGAIADGSSIAPRSDASLLLHWPELAPLETAMHGSGDFRHEIVIVFQPLPPDELSSIPERFVRPEPGKGAGSPIHDLAERLRRPDLHGLEHYVIDEDKRAHYRATVEEDPPRMQSHAFGTGADWYIARDGSGRIRSVILCDPVEISADGAGADEAAWGQLCDGHSFVVPEYGLWVKAGYRHPVLRDWKRIEDAVIALLRAAHRGRVQTGCRSGACTGRDPRSML